MFVIDDDNLSSSPAGGANIGPCAGAGPGAQGAYNWGSPAPDLQWPGTDAPAVIRRCDGWPGGDMTWSWSHDGGRTGKKINVSGVPQENHCQLQQNANPGRRPGRITEAAAARASVTVTESPAVLRLRLPGGRAESSESVGLSH